MVEIHFVSIIQKNHAWANVVDRAPYIKFPLSWSSCKDNEESGNCRITEITGQYFVFFVDYSTSVWLGLVLHTLTINTGEGAVSCNSARGLIWDNCCYFLPNNLLVNLTEIG